MAAHPGAKWFAKAPNGAVLGSEDQRLFPKSTAGVARPDIVSPYLIDDPIAWAACFLRHDQTYSLAHYTYWDPQSNPIIIQLECGYAGSNGTGFGWWHISDQHESQWRDRIIKVGGNANGDGWDDLMSWSNENTLAWPFIDQPRGSNNTHCLSAPTVMYNAKGEWEFTFNPTVVIGTDSKRVITSYPSTISNC